MTETVALSPDQQEAVEELNNAMIGVVRAFVRVDKAGIEIVDALAMIGMEVPLFARPAINQLSGRMREMKTEVESTESS